MYHVTSIHHLGLYVHIPVCEKKCSYCDFYSIEKNAPPVGATQSDFWFLYLQKLKQNLNFFLPRLSSGARLGSVFFGGGTPSLAPSELFAEFMAHVENTFKQKIFSKIETTVEVNPQHVTPVFLRRLHRAKINRVSLGVQSNRQKILDYLERQTTREKNLQALAYLKESPFKNYSMDVMYGIEGQSTSDIQETIEAGMAAGISHLSAYALSIEKGTPLYKKMQRKNSDSFLQREEQAHEQSMWIESFLTKHDFIRYEVSNYRQKKYFSRHNIGYWKYRPYIGIGASAHSFLYNQRYTWARSLEQYLAQTLPTQEASVPADILIGMLRLYLPQSSLYLAKTFSPSHITALRAWLKKMALQNLLSFTETSTEKKILRKHFSFCFSPQAIQFADSYMLQGMDDLGNIDILPEKKLNAKK